MMLVTSVVVLLFPMTTQDGPKDAQVNELAVGLVVAFAACPSCWCSPDTT
ncbi:hypothetical protein [Streptomyces sp. NPDC057325]